jgi:putative endonuclease
MYHVYILYSATINRYYIGSCENIEVRIQQHNSGRNASTKGGVPWQLKKVEDYLIRSEATQRESYIKKMKSRKFTEMVISGER